MVQRIPSESIGYADGSINVASMLSRQSQVMELSRISIQARGIVNKTTMLVSSLRRILIALPG